MPRTSRTPSYEDAASVQVTPAVTSTDLAALGVRAGQTIYLAYDPLTRRVEIVHWHISQWACSCNRGACIHQLAVNTFKIQELQKKD